jgi:hypothetical protein
MPDPKYTSPVLDALEGLADAIEAILEMTVEIAPGHTENQRDACQAILRASKAIDGIRATQRAVSPIPVNSPWERVPEHAWDPGHGPVPPSETSPVERDRERFAKLAAEVRAVIPDGYTAPLDMTPTLVLIARRTKDISNGR